MVEVNPLEQMVALIVAWVTWGSMAPGVQWGWERVGTDQGVVARTGRGLGLDGVRRLGARADLDRVPGAAVVGGGVVGGVVVGGGVVGGGVVGVFEGDVEDPGALDVVGARETVTGRVADVREHPTPVSSTVATMAIPIWPARFMVHPDTGVSHRDAHRLNGDGYGGTLLDGVGTGRSDPSAPAATTVPGDVDENDMVAFGVPPTFGGGSSAPHLGSDPRLGDRRRHRPRRHDRRVRRASGASSSAPGVTSTQIDVAIATRTGVGAGDFAAFIPGMQAYFDMVNSHGGINGRKLDLTADLDDGGSPRSSPRRPTPSSARTTSPRHSSRRTGSLRTCSPRPIRQPTATT